MCRALVQVGDMTDDHTRGLPRHGDVIVLEPDGHQFGLREMQGRRVVDLKGEPACWAEMLGAGMADGAFPLFRQFYFDDTNAVHEREPVPARAGL